MNKFIIGTIIVLIIAAGIWAQNQVSKIDEETKVTPAPVVAPVQEVKKTIPKGDVVRRTRVQRGSEFVENNFYINEELIASQKVYADGHIEQDNDIPDGKVKFFDEYDNTQGEEYYRKNKKHGTVHTYYSDGKLKSESQYTYGELVKNKEYYDNGTVRFEVDYSDALLDGGSEVGVGKLYFPNGFLKFEWNLTRTNRGGYKRSYNQDGTLRSETKYDDHGHIIKEPETVKPAG
jgi:antitoxin component YwqK of YwqJK toxin-antitoxin module